MNKKYKWFKFLVLNTGLFIVSSTSCQAPALAQEASIKSGSSAPNFSLVDTDSKAHKLSDFKGKYVVLEWVNFQCPFVKKHYQSGNMPILQKEYTHKGVVWLSINSSAPGKPGNFPPAQIKETEKKYHAQPSFYLVDADGKVGRLYGAKSTPDMFVINPKGVIVYAGAIDDKPTTDIEDIASATNYVKAALDNSMSGQPIKVAQTKSYGCSVKYAD